MIDLKPNDEARVSLYLLRHVWGYTQEYWTPIAVLLGTIYVDHPVEDPGQFKGHFDDRKASKEPVAEFLYLRGGTKGGTWGWGPVGSVNAPLLWADSFRFFTQALRDYF
ncbi:MAG: hypothetical protein ACODAJ_00495 [Planctomycetota bacterium]